MCSPPCAGAVVLRRMIVLNELGWWSLRGEGGAIEGGAACRYLRELTWRGD